MIFGFYFLGIVSQKGTSFFSGANGGGWRGGFFNERTSFLEGGQDTMGAFVKWWWRGGGVFFKK